MKLFISSDKFFNVNADETGTSSVCNGVPRWRAGRGDLVRVAAATTACKQARRDPDLDVEPDNIAFWQLQNLQAASSRTPDQLSSGDL